MTIKTYYEKLKDPRWQKKRLEVMQHNDFCCEVCGDSESTLNVHHKEYFKGQEPWDYYIEQLSCLCETCHESQHSTYDLLKVVCSYASLDGIGSRTELAFVLAGYMNLSYDGLLKLSDSDDCKHLKNPYLAGVAAKKHFTKLLAKNNGKN
jgi:hypothetical protein